MAIPNGAMRLPSEACGHTGERFSTLPPGPTNPTAIRATNKPILMRVRTFWMTAPSLTPSEFSTVRATMDTIATALIPAFASGTKNPRYVANPTAIAAIDAGLITTPAVQPYRSRDQPSVDRRWVDHDSSRPAVQVPPHRPVSLGQVHVLATRVGHRGAELRDRQRAQEADRSANHPHEDRGCRGAESGRDRARDEENAGRDDRPDVDHRRVEQPELTLEIRHQRLSQVR